jgi:hypothetical protein
MADPAQILEEDLRWREGELASLKLLASKATKGSVQQRSLLRALWALLYAHYEGFCKFAWDFYLEQLGQLPICREDCRTPIARFSLAKHFREARASLDLNSLWSLCSQDFSAWMKDQLAFELRLETNSNLWPNLLIENSTAIDLPTEKVIEHEFKLKALVSRRNEIAHGKKMIIQTIEEYQPYEDASFLVMHELAVAVLDRLEKRSYLK